MARWVLLTTVLESRFPYHMEYQQPDKKQEFCISLKDEGFRAAIVDTCQNCMRLQRLCPEHHEIIQESDHTLIVQAISKQCLYCSETKVYTGHNPDVCDHWQDICRDCLEEHAACPLCFQEGGRFCEECDTETMDEDYSFFVHGFGCRGMCRDCHENYIGDPENVMRCREVGCAFCGEEGDEDSDEDDETDVSDSCVAIGADEETSDES